MNTNVLQTNDRKGAEEAPQMNTPPMHTDHLAHEEHDLSTATSLACFVEFRHARERLLAQFIQRRTKNAPKPVRKLRKFIETLRTPVAAVVAPAPEAAAGCLARLMGCAHPLKTPLAWLSSAAALGARLAR